VRYTWPCGSDCRLVRRFGLILFRLCVYACRVWCREEVNNEPESADDVSMTVNAKLQLMRYACMSQWQVFSHQRMRTWPCLQDACQQIFGGFSCFHWRRRHTKLHACDLIRLFSFFYYLVAGEGAGRCKPQMTVALGTS
jgi:hypothetical protein